MAPPPSVTRQGRGRQGEDRSQERTLAGPRPDLLPSFEPRTRKVGRSRDGRGPVREAPSGRGTARPAAAPQGLWETSSFGAWARLTWSAFPVFASFVRRAFARQRAPRETRSRLEQAARPVRRPRICEKSATARCESVMAAERRSKGSDSGSPVNLLRGALELHHKQRRQQRKAGERRWESCVPLALVVAGPA